MFNEYKFIKNKTYLFVYVKLINLKYSIKNYNLVVFLKINWYLHLFGAYK